VERALSLGTCRLRSLCFHFVLLLLQSNAVARFDRLLLKVPEHTWGLDAKTTLENFNCCGTYSNKHLHNCMAAKTPPTPPPPAAPPPAAAAAAVAAGVDPPGCGGMTRLTESWKRQAAYVDWALQVHPCNMGQTIPSLFASLNLFS
jgi:hypothetical protein